MNTQEAKKIRMEDLLATLGYMPVKTTRANSQIWYNSPLRADKDPSFKIETKFNSWYDFGLGKGGNILDFIMVHEQTDLSNSLSFLDGLNITSFFNTKVASLLGSGIKINKTQDLQNPALLDYLKERKINIDIAKLYLKEVYYRANKKNYFGIGFRNDNGGWEVRNKYFKGALVNKAITTIRKKEPSQQVTVFEGFIDYLSILTKQKKKEIKTDAIILNSTSQAEETITTILDSGYTKVYTLFDNDEAGKTITNQFKEHLRNVVDLSYLYKGFNDPNEQLMSL